MNRMKLLFAALALAASVAVAPVANAQTVHYIGAGSSAMFQGFGIAAYNDLALGSDGSGICVSGHITVVTSGAPSGTTVGDTCTNNHWTVKQATGVGSAKDSRTGGIPAETGNLWVVWVADTTLPAGGQTTDVWAYLQLDSTVGVRHFLASPRGTLQLTSPGAPGGVISSSFFVDGSADQSSLPTDVQTVLNGAAFTAGMTDIRPEDALLATTRILGNDSLVSSNTDTIATLANKQIYAFSLGYGPGPVGTGIKSGEPSSTAVATPVVFGLPGGTDPITSSPVSSTINTFPVGESPIIVVANRSNTTTGLGQPFAHATTACSPAPGEGPAGCTATVHAADQSYAFRNLWSQHPFPAQSQVFPNLNPQVAPSYCSSTGAGTSASSGVCHGPRRPLGSLFAGFDCETDSSAFTWPLDPATQGLRNVPPNGAAKAITLFLREPLSGTYNTFEYSEVRIYGTPGGSQGGNGSGSFEATPYISQETNVVPTATNNNGLVQQCPTKYVGPGEPADPGEGFRYRGLSTGEVISGPTGSLTHTAGQGVLNTTDSLGYTFFSFGNVKNIAFSQQYGYLMIDGVDPLFTAYDGSGHEPGQPVNFLSGTAALNYGVLPACGSAGQPACKVSAIWGSVPSYPHLRDGTYPAWSELRMMCDTADSHCTVSNDAFGAEALVENLQFDIHNSNTGGVPDLLPFSDAASGGLSFTPPYGDVKYIRSHYNAFHPNDIDNAAGQGGNTPPPVGPGPWKRTMWSSTRQGGTQPTTSSPSDPASYISFTAEPCDPGSPAPPVPSTAGQAVNGPPTAECGGDAGGFIYQAISGNYNAVNNLQ